MDKEAYWKKKLASYAHEDWAQKPSLFAQWVSEQCPPPGRLLELGAGHGQDSEYFAGKDYEVTCTDFSESVLSTAEQRLGSTVAYKVVDLADPLPFDDASFDIVYAHLSLHYFDKVTTGRLFSEIDRILKPGGTLTALLNSKDDPEYAENEKTEDGYVLESGIYKRYFNAEDARTFAQNFEVIVADNQGSTYKDEAKGVRNLIRLLARKPA